MFTAHAHEFHSNRWLLLAPNDIPRQKDSCSCGVFMCMNAFIMATNEDINYSSDDITHIRKWIVNFLVKQPAISKERSDNSYHENEINTLAQVPLKSSDILKSIPMNDELIEKSAFNKIKLLAQTRESGDVYMGNVNKHDDTPTTDSVKKSPSQQSGNVNCRIHH